MDASERPEMRTKAALRRAVAERLAALDPAAAQAEAKRVQGRVLALPEVRGARRVLSCLSFGTELDTRPLVQALLADGRELYVPRADRNDRQLHLHRWPCELVTLPFGLQQPPRDLSALSPDDVDSTIDVVLVLGLAFDTEGYRLGYGAGYFDRFLAGRLFPAVGLAFDTQLEDHLPHESHDIPMSVVVTGQRLIRR